MSADTIFALASGRPPAAIGLIRISGPSAHAAARQLAGRLPEPRQATLSALRDRDGQLLDQALLLRFDGPASATGEDVIELHCHGGRAVIDALLAALSAIPGLRLAEPGEFTRRAFANGRIDLTEAEGLADLLAAETESQRRAALRLAEGGLRRQIEQWQNVLLGLAARAEAAIDYVDEDSVDHDPALDGDCAALAAVLDEWLARPRAEPLRDGVRIVVAGPPNAGKSSLVNALAGSDRAIVSAMPGTTRDHIEVPLALAGVPVLLIDTAGLRDSPEPVERIGVARALGQIEDADLLLWLGDPADAPPHPRLVRIYPRCDAPGRGDPPPDTIAVSAVTGHGIGALAGRLAALAGTILPGEDAIALNRRQAEHLAAAAAALGHAAAAKDDIVLVAEQVRQARAAFDRLSGRAGVEDLLDALFGRFCLGK